MQDELAAERKAAEGRLKKAEDELVAKNKAAEERLRQEEEDKLAAEKKANEDIGKLDLVCISCPTTSWWPPCFMRVMKDVYMIEDRISDIYIMYNEIYDSDMSDSKNDMTAI